MDASPVHKLLHDAADRRAHVFEGGKAPAPRSEGRPRSDIAPVVNSSGPSAQLYVCPSVLPSLRLDADSDAERQAVTPRRSYRALALADKLARFENQREGVRRSNDENTPQQSAFSTNAGPVTGIAVPLSFPADNCTASPHSDLRALHDPPLAHADGAAPVRPPQRVWRLSDFEVAGALHSPAALQRRMCTLVDTRPRFLLARDHGVFPRARGAAAAAAQGEARGGAEVVLKVFSARPSTEAAARLEVATHLSVSHPNIVPALAAVHEDGTTALVMEYMHLGTLAERVAAQPNRRLAADDVRRLLLRPCVAALAYLHARGIVHRAVVADNVFLDGGDGGAKLSNFAASARAAVAGAGDGGAWPEAWRPSSANTEDAPSARSSTRTLGAVSTADTATTAAAQPPGAAPDAAPAGPPEEVLPDLRRLRVPGQLGKGDVWALGLLAFELLSGRPVFEPPDARARAYTPRHNFAPMYTGFPEEVPCAARMFVLSMLALNPLLRPSAAELARDPWLQGSPLGDAGAVASGAPLRPLTARLRRSRRVSASAVVARRRSASHSALARRRSDLGGGAGGRRAALERARLLPVPACRVTAPHVAPRLSDGLGAAGSSLMAPATPPRRHSAGAAPAYSSTTPGPYSARGDAPSSLGQLSESVADAEPLHAKSPARGAQSNESASEAGCSVDLQPLLQADLGSTLHDGEGAAAAVAAASAAATAAERAASDSSHDDVPLAATPSANAALAARARVPRLSVATCQPPPLMTPRSGTERTTDEPPSALRSPSVASMFLPTCPVGLATPPPTQRSPAAASVATDRLLDESEQGSPLRPAAARMASATRPRATANGVADARSIEPPPESASRGAAYRFAASQSAGSARGPQTPYHSPHAVGAQPRSAESGHAWGVDGDMQPRSTDKRADGARTGAATARARYDRGAQPSSIPSPSSGPRSARGAAVASGYNAYASEIQPAKIGRGQRPSDGGVYHQRAGVATGGGAPGAWSSASREGGAGGHTLTKRWLQAHDSAARNGTLYDRVGPVSGPASAARQPHSGGNGRAPAARAGSGGASAQSPAAPQRTRQHVPRLHTQRVCGGARLPEAQMPTASDPDNRRQAMVSPPLDTHRSHNGRAADGGAASPDENCAANAGAPRRPAAAYAEREPATWSAAGGSRRIWRPERQGVPASASEVARKSPGLGRKIDSAAVVHTRDQQPHADGSMTARGGVLRAADVSFTRDALALRRRPTSVPLHAAPAPPPADAKATIWEAPRVGAAAAEKVLVATKAALRREGDAPSAAAGRAARGATGATAHRHVAASPKGSHSGAQGRESAAPEAALRSSLDSAGAQASTMTPRRQGLLSRLKPRRLNLGRLTRMAEAVQTPRGQCQTAR